MQFVLAAFISAVLFGASTPIGQISTTATRLISLENHLKNNPWGMVHYLLRCKQTP